MSMKRLSASMTAAVLACGIAAAAQAPATSGADQKAPPVITVTGCVQKESVVLKRNPAAAAIGMSDEFVLTSAAIAPAPGGNDTPKSDVQPQEPTATSGSAGSVGPVYRVTGDKEGELKAYLGQRVAITGRVKEKEKATDKMSSIGTTGGAWTPENTPEVLIESIAAAPGACAPLIK
jgi:hypothetical protein